MAILPSSTCATPAASALILVGQRLRNGNITVREELGEQPLRVRSHQNLLEQALVNLLVNARDALQQSMRPDKTICSRRREAATAMCSSR